MADYDRHFYRYIAPGSLRSAKVVIPLLQELLPQTVTAVLDVGCGVGSWLAVWKQRGCRVTGVDGDYLPRKALLVDDDEFVAADLRSGLALGRRFDLVQCLEVAEHLPPAAAPGLVRDLCRHADLVLFSAAPPGQGGANHVNEQPYGYWRDHFQGQGFALYDVLRPRLAGQRRVAPWYRYNSFLYVREDALPELHRRWADYRVRPGDDPEDVSPILYRLRKTVLGKLPVGVVTALAGWKKNLSRARKVYR